eukprot:3287771-Rhodomonas_salina.1
MGCGGGCPQVAADVASDVVVVVDVGIPNLVGTMVVGFSKLPTPVWINTSPKVFTRSPLPTLQTHDMLTSTYRPDMPGHVFAVTFRVSSCLAHAILCFLPSACPSNSLTPRVSFRRKRPTG